MKEIIDESKYLKRQSKFEFDSLMTSITKLINYSAQSKNQNDLNIMRNIRDLAEKTTLFDNWNE